MDRKRSLFAAAMDCESRSRAFLKYNPSPKHVQLGLLLFIYPALSLSPSLSPSLFAPLLYLSLSVSFSRARLSFSRSPFSFLVFCSLRVSTPILFSRARVSYSLFFSCRARSAPESTDVTEGQARPNERLSGVLRRSSPVIVISTLIRMNRSCGGCAILNITRDT